MIGTAAMAGLLAVTGGRAVAEESTATNVIEFETQNKGDKGSVRCGLFKEAGWLKDAIQGQRVTISGKKALCVFKGVPAGTYGISAFHDEDDDGELDTNIVGYPIEEYCTSNNTRNMFSAPSWSKAKFAYKGGTMRLRGIMK